MTTAERAHAVSAALEHVAGSLPVSPQDLLAPLAAELGHAEILDRFCPLGRVRSHAVARSPLLHIIGDDTPTSGLGSVVRGLLVGAHNRVSAPSTARITPFLEALPDALRSRVELETTSPTSASWLASAAGIIAFAGEPELSAIQKGLRPSQLFEANPPTVGLAIVLDDPANRSPPLLAKDIAQALARGENLIHNIFLAPSVGSPIAFAALLATELDRLPLPGTSPSRAVTDLRASYSFRARGDKTVSVLGGASPSGYTIIAENEPLFATSPAPGTVFVKPLPPDLASALRFVSSNINTIAVHPFDQAGATIALANGAVRTCPLGESASIPPLAHPLGRPLFSTLVRWIDLG